MKQNRDKVIAQCWTVLYRWAINPSDEMMAQSLVRLFRLLEELDPAAHATIFNAAIRDEDFPDLVAARYPVPD